MKRIKYYIAHCTLFIHQVQQLNSQQWQIDYDQYNSIGSYRQR